jgi:predicted DNA-binding protein (UPF0251 family)
MARPIKTRFILQQPMRLTFIPAIEIQADIEYLKLPVECMEAIRLIDVEGMNQAAAARLMNVSRQTFGRILNLGRTIVGNALTCGKGIQIEGGNYEFFENGNQRRYRKRCFQHKQKEINQMPNQDGTGPRGQGKGTGQGKGRCNSGGRGKGNGGRCGSGGGGGKGRGQNQGRGKA